MIQHAGRRTKGKGHIIKLLESLNDEKVVSEKLAEVIKANDEAYEAALKSLAEMQGLKRNSFSQAI